MKKILFVSELGAGLGHIAPLKAVADQVLAQRSDSAQYECVFSVKDCVGAHQAFTGAAFPMLPAPVSEPSQTAITRTSSYSEVLEQIGYLKKDRLTSTLSAWDDVLTLLKPDLIVADHSPSLCLAARGRIPVALIGSAHTMPPVNLPRYPSLRAGVAPAQYQEAMLRNINSVLTDRGQPTLSALPELLNTEKRFVFSLPQADPYAGLRNEELLGSYNEGLRRTDLPDEPHLFLYAGAVPEYLDPIIQAVSQTKAKISAYLGNTNTAAAQFLKLRGGHIYSKPPELSEILPTVTAVMSHGGAGLSQAALIVGRPQIIVPIHFESEATAGRLENLGVGKGIRSANVDDLKNAVSAVMEVRRFSENAQNVARTIADMNLPDSAMHLVAKGVLELLEST